MSSYFEYRLIIDMSLLDTFVENLVVEYLSPLNGTLIYVPNSIKIVNEKLLISLCLYHQTIYMLIISDIKKYSDNLHLSIKLNL